MLLITINNYFYYAISISEKIKKNHQKMIMAYLENIFALGVEEHV